LTLIVIAAVCAGLFSGAALYVNLVEHPARLSCGSEIALREFAPSYKRGTVLQASLAVLGSLAGIVAAWRRSDTVLAAASLLLVAVVPFTLVAILPTNKRLLDPALDPRSTGAATLLARWGRLHAVRSVLSLLAFLAFLWRLANG
jgi:anthrone oxygenase-like protein